MENLAPAGNREALERADAAGADAVYLGYSAFSARAGAGNFNREELAEAIRYAHLRHMRVHVTVNTLVKDGELEAAAEVLRMLNRLHADAVLVQDLGILRIARAMTPGLTIHASTQMAIHNRTGAAWCARQGIRRVVLARECSLEEIRKSAGAGAEIEVFGHGAQCVAVSGLCLFSSMVGERSGNRGRCAQPCRKTYRYRGREGAWLSPRDVCLRNDLPALMDAGAVSVKLEGRLKRPEYVAVTTAAYRRGIDAAEAGRFRPADEAEMQGLKQIFSRGGFMRGYTMGCEDAGVIFPETAGHTGPAIGRITRTGGNLARVLLTAPLKNGDGLHIGRGGDGGEMIYAGPDAAAGETAAIRLREGIRATAGDPVYRFSSAEQLEAARAMPGRRITADLFLRAMPGEAMTLTATDGESTVTVSGETVSAARTRAAEAEELIRSLSRTGDTVFIPGTVRAETAGAFIPVSAVNSLRRQALDALAEARIKAFEPPAGPEGSIPPAELPEGEAPATALARTGEQAEAARNAGSRVVWYPEDYRKEAVKDLLDSMPAGDWLQIPPVCEEETLEMLRGLCEAYREKLGGVVLGSVGQLGTAWPVPYGAGSGIPVMNRQAAALLFEEGCTFVTASEELTGGELKELTAGGAPIMVRAWGRTQLMLLHHCPARTALGLDRGHRDCTMCDRHAEDALEGNVLEDPRGYRYPLLRQRLPEGCLVRLMNALPTEWTDKGIRMPAAEFTGESREEAERVLEAIREKKRTGMETTSGHWQRKAE